MTVGTAHYDYLYDGKGNVNALIDATQTPVVKYRNDAFGVLVGKSSATGLSDLVKDQPYQFSTQRYYASIGVLKYHRRDDLPVLGSWMERDPLGEARGANRYLFNNNSPMNYVDPFGLASLFEDYSTTRKIGGSLSWRNNNPGNMNYGGRAELFDAVRSQSNRRFAKFPNEDIGHNALVNLLTEKYGALKVREAMPIYAPEDDDNDPDAYLNYLEDNGIDLDQTVSGQEDDLANLIKNYEGWKHGKIKKKKKKKGCNK